MKEQTEIIDKILASLEENDALKRKHADFWNFHKKTSKELGIFSEIFEHIQDNFGSEIIEWGLCEEDPPDIFAKLSDKSIKGVEITELVNEKAIEAQITRKNYSEELSNFDYHFATSKLRSILKEKEAKVSSIVHKYSGLSLLIHTDEFLLKSDQFIGKGTSIFPNGSKLFEAVYLLFSYEPEKQSCPILRLL